MFSDIAEMITSTTGAPIGNEPPVPKVIVTVAGPSEVDLTIVSYNNVCELTDGLGAN